MLETIIDTISVQDSQLVWLNRDNEPKVVANKKRALNGAPHIQNTVITAGLPIVLGTLNSGLHADDFIDLQAHSNSTFQSFDLTIEGQTQKVVWDHTEGAAVTGEDLFQTIGGHDYKTNVTLRFLSA